MFVGTHYPRLDDKGRLTLPAKFRDALAGGAMITKGQERCLYVFTPHGFEDFARRFGQGLPNNEAMRAFQRQLFAATDEQRPDGQGRISVAPELRRYAGLGRECVVLGVNNRLEIWDGGAWDDYVTEHEEAYARAQEEVLPGVF